MARNIRNFWFDGAPCFTPADERRCGNCLFWAARRDASGNLTELNLSPQKCRNTNSPKRHKQTSLGSGCGAWEMIQPEPPEEKLVDTTPTPEPEQQDEHAEGFE